MSAETVAGSKARTAVAFTFVALCCATYAFVGRDIDLPGLYYDEVIQAEPALQYLAPDGRPSEIPGARTTRLFGGWFPVAIQPYMGALKSQLLIPVFAGFGASAASLRFATTTAALLGLLFTLLWARDLLGTQTAIVTGLLLASDPSFLWIARHDWGSFSLALLLRCAGLVWVTRGWQRESVSLGLIGGFCFGLGIYNKIDFGVFLAAAGLALAVARPATLRELAHSRGRRALPAGSGFAVGAAPVLAAVGAVFAATSNVVQRQATDHGDWLEKAQTLWATLDGSYFHRLMSVGGSFERMYDAPGSATGLFGIAFAAAFVTLGVALKRDRRSGRSDPAQAFVWLATAIVALGIFLTPRAVRIHHALNLYPFPHLVVAIALMRLADAGSALRRAAAVVALAAVVAAGLWVDVQTRDVIQASGGKGRWAHALGEFAGELEREKGAVAVGLDWGFIGNMRFAARDLAVAEPIWVMRRAHLPGQAWHFDGGPQHVYLAFEPDLAVFEYGEAFLDAVAELPPGQADVSRHTDRQGDVAFVSVRFARPHRLTYDGHFEVEIR